MSFFNVQQKFSSVRITLDFGIQHCSDIISINTLNNLNNCGIIAWYWNVTLTQYNQLIIVFDSGCSNLIQGLKQKAHIHPDTHWLLTPSWISYRNWQWSSLNLLFVSVTKADNLLLYWLPGWHSTAKELTATAKRVVRISNLCLCSHMDVCLQENLLALLIKHHWSILGLVIVHS